MSDELIKLIEDYLTQYPSEENPLEHTATISFDQLEAILEARALRKIKFYYIKGRDNVQWEYLPLAN